MAIVDFALYSIGDGRCLRVLDKVLEKTGIVQELGREVQCRPSGLSFKGFEAIVGRLKKIRPS